MAARQEQKRQKRSVKQPPEWYQVWVLAIRNVKFYLRNPELMLAKLFTYIFMGGFMGACPLAFRDITARARFA